MVPEFGTGCDMSDMSGVHQPPTLGVQIHQREMRARVFERNGAVWQFLIGDLRVCAGGIRDVVIPFSAPPVTDARS